MVGGYSRSTLRALAGSLAVIAACAAHAAADRFDYDPAGRLIRRIDDQNRATDYTYDASGNITRVTEGAAVDPLSVTPTTLGNLRQNETRQVTLSGTGMTGVVLRPSDSRIHVSDVVASANAIYFRLYIASNTPVGAQAIFVENAAGSVAVGFNVLPVLAFAIEPSPITVPPDGVARRYILHLPEPLADSTSFNLTTQSPSVAAPSAGAVTVAAGQTQGEFGVIGRMAGTTVLRISTAAMVDPVEALVFVEPGGANREVFARRVEVRRGVPWVLPEGGLAGFGSPIVVRRGGQPWFAASSGYQVGTVRVRRWTPWSDDAKGIQIYSPLISIQRQ